MDRRQLLTKAMPAIACATLPLDTFAKTYPTKPIRLILPYSAGSGTDVLARALASGLQQEIGGSIVIENKPGANGSLAAEQIARAPADGYTLGIGTISPHSANPWLYKRLPYRPIDDFTAIARIITFPFYLAVPSSSPYRTLDQFLQGARGANGKFNMGHGNATGLVAGAHLMEMAKFDAVSIAYKSTPQVLVDLVGGQVDFAFVDLASSQALLKEGRVRCLATMSAERLTSMPDAPALGERFAGFNFVAWGGLVGPARLPPALVDSLSVATLKVISSQSMKDRFLSLGLEANPGNSKEFSSFMQQQLQLWGASIKQAGIQPE